MSENIEKKKAPQGYIDHDLEEINYKKTLERINAANKMINYIPITKGGKTTNYAEVKERIKAFRFVYPRGAILTKIISEDKNTHEVTVQATIMDENGAVLATGYASETLGKSMVNKTSILENCESSSIGRALGFAGFGIEGGVATAEEVRQATTWKDNESGLVMCHRCGRPIRDTDLYTAERIARESLKAYGDTFCMPCLRELKNIKTGLEEAK